MKGLGRTLRKRGRHVVQATPVPLAPLYLRLHCLECLDGESHFRDSYVAELESLRASDFRTEIHYSATEAPTRRCPHTDLATRVAQDSLTTEYVAELVARMGLVIDELFDSFVAVEDFRIDTLGDRLPLFVEAFFLPGYPLGPPGELCSERVVISGAGRSILSAEPPEGRDTGALRLPEALRALRLVEQVLAIAPGAIVPIAWIGTLDSELATADGTPLAQSARPLEFVRLCHDVSSSVATRTPEWCKQTDTRNLGLVRVCQAMGTFHAFGLHVRGAGFDTLSREGWFTAIDEVVAAEDAFIWPTQALGWQVTERPAGADLVPAILDEPRVRAEAGASPWVSCPVLELVHLAKLVTWRAAELELEAFIPSYVDAFLRGALARRGIWRIAEHELAAHTAALATAVTNAIQGLSDGRADWAVVEAATGTRRIFDAQPELTDEWERRLKDLASSPEAESSPCLSWYQQRPLGSAEKLGVVLDPNDDASAALARNRRLIAAFVSDNRRCNPLSPRRSAEVRVDGDRVIVEMRAGCSTDRLLATIEPSSVRLVTLADSELHRHDVELSTRSEHSLLFPGPRTDSVIEALWLRIGDEQWLEPVGPWFVPGSAC